MSIKDIFESNEERMNKAIEVLRKEYGSLRAGRASSSLLDKVMVDYYGSQTQVKQVANISVPEPRTIVIQPWEKNMLSPIERAIQKSDLGLSPNSDGIVIRLNIPQLTQDRRTELTKVIHKKAEEARVAIRYIRRDANVAIKKCEKDRNISEDEAKKAQDDMQKLTDKHIKDVDHLMTIKEKEIIEV